LPPGREDVVIRVFAIRAATAVTMLFASLGLVGALAVVTSTPAAAQTTTPATPTCPAGFTLTGTTCTLDPACPNGGFAVDATLGFPGPGCFDLTDPMGPFLPATATFPCPAGSTFGGFTPLGGPDSFGTCTLPATFICPVGTLNGVVCDLPATAAPAAATCEGVVFQGQCFLPGSTGPADASGGNAGDASGGDGGRGGHGTGASCSQNGNDVADAANLDCAEGGVGGAAGDGGISEAGDGGLAFTDSFF
jgi:hypothetical protein